MENRSINENWEIIDAAGWRLCLDFDETTGKFMLCVSNQPRSLDVEINHARQIPLSMTSEIVRLGEAWADLCIANKRATAEKKRLLRLVLPLVSTWGYDARNHPPAGFYRPNFLDIEDTIIYEHNRLRHIVAGCEIDKAMAAIIARNAALSAERDRRALAAAIPARPAPAHRAGWL